MNSQTTLTTLWQGASYQDHLLQSYRKLHILLQSVLLAIATALTLVVLLFHHDDMAMVYVLLLAFSALGIYLLIAISKLIMARAADVDYYHNQIIECERALPKEEQVLTAFKVYQKFGRGKSNPNEFFLQFQLTEEVRSQLTEKGKGHTRKVIDGNLALGFMLLWIGLHVVIILNWAF